VRYRRVYRRRNRDGSTSVLSVGPIGRFWVVGLLRAWKLLLLTAWIVWKFLLLGAWLLWATALLTIAGVRLLARSLRAHVSDLGNS